MPIIDPFKAKPTGIIDPFKSKNQPEPYGATGTWEEAKKYRLGEAIKTGASNITGESSKQTLNNIYNMIRHPWETSKVMGAVGAGAISHLMPEGKIKKWIKDKNLITDMEEETASMVWQQLSEDYGGYENIKRTIAEKPLQASIDILTIMKGGTSVASKTATKAGLPMVGKAVKYADPLFITKKVMQGISKSVTGTGREVLGVTTGAGPHSIREAYVAGKRFRQALRGKFTGKQIYDEAKGSFDRIKVNRDLQYERSLREINMNQSLSINSLKNSMRGLLDDYGIVTNNKGKIIRGTVDKGEWRKIETVLKYIDEQGNVADDLTGKGFHKLKKFLDSTSKGMINSKGQSTTGGTMVGKLRDKVVRELEKIPGYADMNKNYAIKTQVMNDIDTVLNLRGKNPQTAISKITNSLRQNQEYVREIVDLLEVESGKELTELIAGLTLNPKVPTGHLGRVLSGVGALSGGVGTATGVISPWFLTILSIGSPRLMGEFVHALGRGVRTVKSVPISPSKIAVTTGQAHKLIPEGEQ